MRENLNTLVLETKYGVAPDQVSDGRGTCREGWLRMRKGVSGERWD